MKYNGVSGYNFGSASKEKRHLIVYVYGQTFPQMDGVCNGWPVFGQAALAGGRDLDPSSRVQASEAEVGMLPGRPTAAFSRVAASESPALVTHRAQRGPLPVPLSRRLCGRDVGPVQGSVMGEPCSGTCTGRLGGRDGAEPGVSVAWPSPLNEAGTCWGSRGPCVA